MGEPRVLVGMSGVELFYEVYYEVTGAECDVKPSGCYDKSPEYFAGWSLAYYSWYRNMSYDDIQKIIPSTGEFETSELSGMLELTSLSGNVVTDEEGEYCHHTHAMFTYKQEGGEHCVSGGHINSIEVLYTAEIELRPVIGGIIGRKYDPETGTGFWDFK